MKKFLFVFLAALVLAAGGCDFTYLPGSLPSDADFISLSGTRLKTFYLTPDRSELEAKSVSFSFRGGTFSYTTYTSSYEPPNPGGPGGYYNNPSGTGYFTNSFGISSSLAAFFFPENNYAVSIGGQFFLRNAYPPSNPFDSPFLSGLQTNSFSKEILSSELLSLFPPLVFYEEVFEEEDFESGSFNLPEKGFLPDANYFEYRNLSYNLTISASQSASFSGVSGSHTDLSLSSPTQGVHTIRKTSKGFYLYRSVSVSYAPQIEIFGWQPVVPNAHIIDFFELDKETNTLTAYMKDYQENTTGDIFSFFIIAEDGSYKQKFVRIGD